ncbi:hypothetical protein D3C78_298150 [compost metagenome]
MPAKGIKGTKTQLRKIVRGITGPRATATLTEVLIVAQGYATLWTPADTGNLRNSQYRIVQPYNGGVRGRIGYTARYAAAVHEASGKLRGQPRGKNRGNYWDPDGRPGFLREAFEVPDIDAIVKRGMSL